ncbi:helix-turn-helix domain-containing protein [Leucobacter sp. HY1910]
MVEEEHRSALSRLLTGVGQQQPGADWERDAAAAMAAGQLTDAEVSSLRDLQKQLASASRSEGLLRLLYDTSTDLIGIRDVEVILKAIVRRTRSLIGTDIAYLSLNDYERGESYVRVTDGATTSAFRNIRVPLGGGVLGAVATGAAPAQSANYPEDMTKTHFPDSDAAVIGEGVKAIMGVPLWAEGRVIGALMVADRRAHDFNSSDISLIESIGAHAAVALENARLFTDMTRTLDQLHDAQRENLEQVRSLEALASLDQSLMETLAAQDIILSLRQLIAQTLGAQVWILDPGGAPIGDAPASRDFRGADLRDAATASRAARTPVSYSLNNASYGVMSAIAADQHLAVIVIEGDCDATMVSVLERSALVLSAAMLFDRTLRDAQYRMQRELVDELLSPRTEITDLLRDRARRFGVDTEAELSVRVVGTASVDRTRAVTLLRSVSPSSRVVAAYADTVCVIEPVPQTGRDDDGCWIIDVLQANGITATVGASAPHGGLAHLPQSFLEARAVHNALVALERYGEAADMPKLGTAGMLLGSTDRSFARHLLAAQLGPLLEYDQKRGTELMYTAWVFLDADSAQAESAKRLHIHTNTMRQRLDRIDGILGRNWRRGGRALDIHIALQLWRLREHGLLD